MWVEDILKIQTMIEKCLNQDQGKIAQKCCPEKEGGNSHIFRSDKCLLLSLQLRIISFFKECVISHLEQPVLYHRRSLFLRLHEIRFLLGTLNCHF